MIATTCEKYNWRTAAHMTAAVTARVALSASDSNSIARIMNKYVY